MQTSVQSPKSKVQSPFHACWNIGRWTFDFGPHRAFTLVELMTVIAIVGIMVAMIIPEMRGTYEDALLRSASRDLVNVFEIASSRAISLNQLHRVALDTQSGRYVVER